MNSVDTLADLSNFFGLPPPRQGRAAAPETAAEATAAAAAAAEAKKKAAAAEFHKAVKARQLARKGKDIMLSQKLSQKSKELLRKNEQKLYAMFMHAEGGGAATAGGGAAGGGAESTSQRYVSFGVRSPPRSGPLKKGVKHVAGGVLGGVRRFGKTLKAGLRTETGRTGGYKKTRRKRRKRRKRRRRKTRRRRRKTRRRRRKTRRRRKRRKKYRRKTRNLRGCSR